MNRALLVTGLVALQAAALIDADRGGGGSGGGGRGDRFGFGDGDGRQFGLFEIKPRTFCSTEDGWLGLDMPEEIEEPQEPEDDYGEGEVDDGEGEDNGDGKDNVDGDGDDDDDDNDNDNDDDDGDDDDDDDDDDGKGDKRRLKKAFKTLKAVRFFCAGDLRTLCELGVLEEPSCAEVILENCAECFPEPPAIDRECVCACESANQAVADCTKRGPDGPNEGGDDDDDDDDDDGADAGDGGDTDDDPVRRLAQRLRLRHLGRRGNYGHELGKLMLGIKECLTENVDAVSDACKAAIVAAGDDGTGDDGTGDDDDTGDEEGAIEEALSEAANAFDGTDSGADDSGADGPASGSSGGAIAGAVVAGGLLVAAAAFVVNRRQQQASAASSPSAGQEEAPLAQVVPAQDLPKAVPEL